MEKLNMFLDRIILPTGNVLYGVLSIARSFSDLGLSVVYKKYFKGLDASTLGMIPKGSRLQAYVYKDKSFILHQEYISTHPISYIGYVPAKTLMDLIVAYDDEKLFGNLPSKYAEALLLLWKQKSASEPEPEPKPKLGIYKCVEYRWGYGTLTIAQEDFGEIVASIDNILDKLDDCSYHTKDFTECREEYISYADLLEYLKENLGTQELCVGKAAGVLADVKKYMQLFEENMK